MPDVISLELNELNFEFVKRYLHDLRLPNFERLLTKYRQYTTIAERRSHHLEPWIQWVTAHTGLNFADHQVFRLGDIVNTTHQQIWEKIEGELRLKVGAMSPMNARLAAKKPAFFVPDPWTSTGVRGSWDVKMLYDVVRQAVGDNADGKISSDSLIKLALAGLVNVDWGSIGTYLGLALKSRNRKWLKAGILDLLLTDAFVTQWRKHRPAYSSLFLNAGAHIQHHYMFSSRYYQGPHQNPAWYVGHGVDPLEDIYRAYDIVLGKTFRLVDRHKARLLVLTGLGQTANPDLVFYYRPINHKALLERISLTSATNIEPRMSRDFLVTFSSVKKAAEGEYILRTVVAEDGLPIFSVDNRGDTLFVMVAYTKEMRRGMTALQEGRVIKDFDSMFVHVSIENAIHSTVGYFFDCGEPSSGSEQPMPLKDVFGYTFSRVAEVCR
jgi:hypothetical protein